jgi:serine/threonine protein kinase
VHRDLKPANILLTSDGRLKVTDFGIARSLSDTHTRLTERVANTSGTLRYMSPQQLLGEDPAASDDIYALGVTLDELLTGKPLFHTGDVPTQIRDVIPKPVNARLATLGLKAVPAEWEETIQSCLAKRPEDRPKSAAGVAERLGLGETAKHSKPNGEDPLAIRADSRLPVIGILLGALALIVALIIGGVALAKVSDLQDKLASLNRKVTEDLPDKLSSLDKRVPENLQERLTSAESDARNALSSARNAASIADKAGKDIVSLTRSTQTAFDAIGPEIGGLKDSVKNLEDAATARAAARNRTLAPDAPAGVSAAGPDEYVVKPGDTGSKIAKELGISIHDLETANPGVNWAHLRVGQTIKTK